MQSSRLGRIVGYALSQPAAYLVVGLVFVAVIVAIVGHWPGWTILASVAVGIVLLGLLVLDSLTDPGAERESCLADVDPSRISDAAVRAKLRQALDYVRAAQRLAASDTSGALDSADDELPQMEQAVRSIYQMSLRLQEYRADRLMRRDLAELEGQKSRWGRLTDEQEQHLAALRRVDQLMQTAEREIESALAQLGRSYAEMQAIRITPEVRGRAVEAFRELGEATRRLSDLAQGYDEAYGSRVQPRGSRARG